MNDLRRLEVSNTSAKKSEVVDRTVSERKYCAIDQYYYSEMFTCPICYGAEQERERIFFLIRHWALEPEVAERLVDYIKRESPDEL